VAARYQSVERRSASSTALAKSSVAADWPEMTPTGMSVLNAVLHGL
jgi:hypothetical protein